VLSQEYVRADAGVASINCGEGEDMRKRSLLALLAIATFAAAVAVGFGAGAASAGEVTGNCNHAKPGSAAADNCKKGQNENANSICSFSGQNDDPGSTNPENPGGNTQSYGQDVKSGTANPSQENPGNVRGAPPNPEAFPHPGAACNGNHGFLSEP
jgi:hypothetical protein